MKEKEVGIGPFKKDLIPVFFQKEMKEKEIGQEVKFYFNLGPR